MTLVIGAHFCRSVMMVSDRLTTRRMGSSVLKHDAQANKNIVMFTKTGVLLIGYTGAAYMGGYPTDEWMARVLLETALSANPGLEILPDVIGTLHDSVPERTFTILSRLLSRLSAHPDKDKVELLIVGMNARKGRLRRLVIKSRAGVHENLIPRFGGYDGWASVGQQIPQYLTQKLNNGAWVPGHRAHIELIGETIRAVSELTTTVGSDLMELIVSYHDKTLYVRYRHALDHDPMDLGYLTGPPAHVQEFTPWFITPSGFHPPLVLTGGGVTSHISGYGMSVEAETGSSLIYEGAPPIVFGNSDRSRQDTTGFGAIAPQRRKR